MLVPVTADLDRGPAARPLKILFLSWKDLAHPNAGGSEVVVDELAMGLRARGHEVALVCGGPIEARPYRVVDNGGRYSQYLTAPLRYAREFRDVDLVVEVVNGMPFFSPVWRRGPRLCVLFHVHGEQWHRYFPTPVASTFRRIEARGVPVAYRNTRFVTISASTGDELVALGIDPAAVHVMDLGATVAEPVTPVERTPEPQFLYVGRLAANKRVELLLEHWVRVAPQTGGRLVLAGDGPDRSRIEARVAAEPALRDVVVEGRVSEARKAELLRESWLLVHPAEREGWGLTIVEAGLCGTPAIAYDVPGVRDAIVHDVTGALVADDDAFVAEWIALTEDAERRARLGERAAARAAEFTWDRAVDTFLEAARLAIETHREGEPRRLSVVRECERDGATGALPPDSDVRESAVPTTGIARSVHLLKLFRKEAADPDTFYHYLAADTLRHMRRYVDPAGRTAIDIGGGPGYTAEALEAAGARCHVVEYNFAELGLHDRSPASAMVGDGQALPLRDGCAGIVHSSNVLEHVPDWRAMLHEMVRVLEPERGLGYLTLTNWLSPWGGHETSPWHYLGGERAVERYRRRYGVDPKNEYGVSLFPIHIRDVLAWFRDRPDVETLWEGSRYLPDWSRWIVRVPGAREIVTWNLAVVFRRRGATR
ncbi:MAG: glycosyltransferase [Actinobacteria bacterium]|nr:glycosyltransferase [Actinomycetota bacterium]